MWLQAIWSHSVEAMMASWTTACQWWLQMQRSCRAHTMTSPLRILRSAEHPAQAWMPMFSASWLTLWRSWVWNGLPQGNRPIATWMNDSCRGTTILAPLLNHWFILSALHKPMAVQLHCVIKKRLHYRRKRSFPLSVLIIRSTRSLAQGTEVMLVTEYVLPY